MTKTDWDNYYRKAPGVAGFTRSISERKIIRLLQSHISKSNPKIMEFGGANSCFAEAIINEISPDKYTVVDNNQFGLDLFKERFSEFRQTDAVLADILELSLEKEKSLAENDVVFSVGLIEHFEAPETKKCIESHFHAAKPDGLVLITFPTPTLLYRVIRKAAEVLGVWAFPDERPLGFDEVVSGCAPHGRLLHRSINWKIGLTQGYVLYLRNS